MKSARTLITICLLFTAAILFAQTTPSQRLMKINIPVAFSVGDAKLPAGQYLLYTISPAAMEAAGNVQTRQGEICETRAAQDKTRSS